MNPEEFEIVENMERFGGSFVQSLAQCFYHADRNNFLKLKMAFLDLWDEYSDPKWRKDAKELSESDDYDVKNCHTV